MHLTVRKYRKVEGDRGRFTEAINRTFVPMISKIDGFIDYYCMFGSDGALLTVSVFRDAKGADESVRAAARWLEENKADFVSEKPEVMSGEVFAHQHVQQKKAA